MLRFILDLVTAVRVFFLCRTDLALEILALRQRVAVLKRKRPRPKLNRMDRLFWTALRSFWSRWAEALLIVKPETVVGWHRAGFRLYWRWRSRGSASGRAKITPEIQELIQRMAKENPTWGAPKIHGELLKLGFKVSERSVSRYIRAIQRRGDPGRRWLTFLRNHREAIVAMDFFTVPTVSFRVLYCLFIIEHARRRILYFHVTAQPNSDWVAQQLREAFPDSTPYRYMILDRDTKFDAEVLSVLRSIGLKPKRTSRESPWQNGVAERWVGSCRRELLDHVIPLNEHLSIDNIFVFLVIFSYFAVPAAFQHRVLLWGILGALLLRAIFLLLGTSLLQKFRWVIYIFGAFLVVTGIKLLVQRSSEVHPERNPMFRLFQRLLPFCKQLPKLAFHRGREREALCHAIAPGPGGH